MQARETSAPSWWRVHLACACGVYSEATPSSTAACSSCYPSSVQVGVLAVANLSRFHLEYTELRPAAAAPAAARPDGVRAVPASAFNCFNLGGVNDDQTRARTQTLTLTRARFLTRRRRLPRFAL